MAPGGDRPGWTWCDNCGKWKADQAFVRGRYKRESDLWERCGFMWKKYKTCNRCSRVYYRKPVMSVAEFTHRYGAGEHNDSEPDLDMDEDDEGKDESKDESKDEGKDEGGEGGAVAAAAA